MKPSLVRAATSIMGKTYELSLTKTYVARWGVVQAIRELIQNALDSESPFSYEFIAEEEGGVTLRLNSEFSTLTPQTLLLGSTSKADSEDSIGSFGEGYKIALLVLTREGYDVELLNGDLVWRPRFRFSKNFGEELLVIDESVAQDRVNRGLTFLVHGLDSTSVEKIKDSCLLMQSHIGQIKNTKYGVILLDQPGKLYVGSLFVCDTELKYGYSILPKYLRLERDRQTVSGWDLKSIVVKMWYDTEETEFIAEMILNEVPDVEYAQYNSPQLVKEECYRVFRKNNPGALIASSPAEMKRMIEDGMTNTVYIGSVSYAVISGANEYRQDSRLIRVAKLPPNAILSAWLAANRSEMRTKAIVAFRSLIKEAEKWALK